ncbi:hypothetical protein [Variovorax davisae]|uniref:hypothetical protein n=1 Tax=Variovorax davisae TaxID=3053515 RepID=UPI0025767EF8|nr:hypothetical protein [Variovorax sp. J22P271]
MTALTIIALTLARPGMAYTEAEYEDASRALRAVYAGDNAAIPVALDKFKALSPAGSADPLVMVNVGAATSLQSRATILPWKKISYAEDGMAIQDKAIALLTPAHDASLYKGTPVSLHVRLVAASTFLSVPRFFNREAQGGKILNGIMDSPLFEQANPQFKGATWMRAARWAVDEKRLEDAKKYLLIVIERSAPQAHEAAAQLAAIQ